MKTNPGICLAISVIATCTALVVAQETKKTPTNNKPAVQNTPTVTPPKAPPTTNTNTATPPKHDAPGANALPPGMTEADMQAMMAAATPGPMQAWLCEDAGTWKGACMMWMAPGVEATKSESTYTVTPILGGRFIQQHASGDMGEWGPFEGFGMVGFDNAKGEFQASWGDTMGTAMMCGTGSLNSDNKELTINFSYFCPMQKKTCAFKQTITRNTNGTRTMRMFGDAPGTGEHFKMMETTYTLVHAQAKHNETTKNNSKHAVVPN